jgi:sugar lactone lactonase YvrE
VPPLELVVDGLGFGEGPRWHDGRLWWSDMPRREVCAVTPGGAREVVWGDLPDRPSGLGWLPDGRLLVVAMDGRRVLREEAGALVVHAELGAIARGPCNDMVVAGDGTAYVGNFGFDFEARERPAPASLALVRPDGRVELAATDLRFPNGSVLTPDGRTLVVGESYGQRATAFAVAPDGTLGERRLWADLQGISPDGCTLDAEGAIWFADATGSQVVRVHEGGRISARIPTPSAAYACALGGDDGRTLFVVCALGTGPRDLRHGGGRVLAARVDVPHAGWP